MEVQSQQPCFGRDYNPTGIFCKTCPEQTECIRTASEILNTPGAPNTNLGDPMFEAHVQETPQIIFPGNGAPFTPEKAVQLVKVKKQPEPEGIEGEPRQRGKRSSLKIPFKAGTREYQKAFYWCHKLGKTYPEIKDQLESSTDPVPQKVVEKPDSKQTLPSEETSAREAERGATQHTFDSAVLSVLKEISTILTRLNDNVSTLNSNMQEVRRGITGLSDDMKRYSRGKH